MIPTLPVCVVHAAYDTYIICVWSTLLMIPILPVYVVTTAYDTYITCVFGPHCLWYLHYLCMWSPLLMIPTCRLSVSVHTLGSRRPSGGGFLGCSGVHDCDAGRTGRQWSVQSSRHLPLDSVVWHNEHRHRRTTARRIPAGILPEDSVRDRRPRPPLLHHVLVRWVFLFHISLPFC